jgi:hypothetical protein
MELGAVWCETGRRETVQVEGVRVGSINAADSSSQHHSSLSRSAKIQVRASLFHSFKISFSSKNTQQHLDPIEPVLLCELKNCVFGLLIFF